MTNAEHKERHQELHRCLDELIADFIHHTKGLLSECNLLDLMQWSHAQTVSPTEVSENDEEGTPTLH